MDVPVAGDFDTIYLHSLFIYVFPWQHNSRHAIYFSGFLDDGLIYNRVINPKEFSIQAE